MLQYYLRKKLKLDTINAYIGHSRSNNRLAYRSQVRVACVQKAITPVRHIEEYVDHIASFVKQAAERNSVLIVFPEYVFFDLFGLLPGFTALNRLLNRQAQTRTTFASSNSGLLPLYTLFAATAEPMRQAVESIMCFLAKKYNITIYSGTYLLKERDGLYNAGTLISDEGVILGRQKKIHLTDFEAALGLRRGDELQVFPRHFARIACPICMDASYYETFHIASALGADIVTIPIANNEPYHVYRSLRGIWPRVQESYVFGLKAALNGWIGGMHFTGKAGIFAPLEMTDDRNGVIAISEHHEGDELVIGDLDFAQLREVREQAEYYGDSNPAFEADYVTNTYGLDVRSTS